METLYCVITVVGFCGLLLVVVVINDMVEDYYFHRNIETRLRELRKREGYEN